MDVSVAMTTFNGEKYIKMQLDSILGQMNDSDEVVICDDGSTDNTLNILKEYAKKDKRIKIFINKRIGVVRNFELAISKCNNDLIFLSDQDDIWKSNKISVIKSAFNHINKLLILHNAIDFYDSGCEKESLLIPRMNHGILNNLIKSSYWGCCMVFKKEFVDYILPFPHGLVAHDQWIGLIAESRKESMFVDQCLIMHRRHAKNVTNRLPVIKKMLFRLNLLVRLINYLMQINTLKTKIFN